jgi:hypothetical protein
MFAINSQCQMGTSLRTLLLSLAGLGAFAGEASAQALADAATVDPPGALAG